MQAIRIIMLSGISEKTRAVVRADGLLLTVV